MDTGLGSLFARRQLCLFSFLSNDTRTRLPLPSGVHGQQLSLSTCTWNLPWGRCLLCSRSSPEVPESGPCMPFLLNKVPNFAVSGKSWAPGNPLFWHPRPPGDGVPCLPEAAHESGLVQMCPGLRKTQGCPCPYKEAADRHKGVPGADPSPGFCGPWSCGVSRSQRVPWVRIGAQAHLTCREALLVTQGLSAGSRRPRTSQRAPRGQLDPEPCPGARQKVRMAIVFHSAQPQQRLMGLETLHPRGGPDLHLRDGCPSRLDLVTHDIFVDCAAGGTRVTKRFGSLATVAPVGTG